MQGTTCGTTYGPAHGPTLKYTDNSNTDCHSSTATQSTDEFYLIVPTKIFISYGSHTASPKPFFFWTPAWFIVRQKALQEIRQNWKNRLIEKSQYYPPQKFYRRMMFCNRWD